MGASTRRCTRSSARASTSRSASGRSATRRGPAHAWAGSGVRVDPESALEEIEGALQMSRRIDYPIGVAVNLRSAPRSASSSSTTSDRPRSTISELLDEVVDRRSEISHARLVVDVAAVLAHRIGDGSWEPLPRTAATLPTATLVGAGYELVPLPAGHARPLGRREAIAMVVRLLADETSVADPAPAPAIRAPGGRGVAPSLVARGAVWEVQGQR